MSSIHEEQPKTVQANPSDNNTHHAVHEAVELAKKHGLGVAYPIMVTTTLAVPFVGSNLNCWGCG